MSYFLVTNSFPAPNSEVLPVFFPRVNSGFSYLFFLLSWNYIPSKPHIFHSGPSGSTGKWLCRGEGWGRRGSVRRLPEFAKPTLAPWVSWALAFGEHIWQPGWLLSFHSSGLGPCCAADSQAPPGPTELESLLVLSCNSILSFFLSPASFFLEGLSHFQLLKDTSI